MQKGRKAGNKGVIIQPRTQTPMIIDNNYKGVRFVPKHVHTLSRFEGVKIYKSIWRAITKKYVNKNGIVIPTRPFNNSKRTRGRKLQVTCEKVLQELKLRNAKQYKYKES